MKNNTIILSQAVIHMSMTEKDQTDRSTILAERHQYTSSQC
jgi:hypothetical protein